MGGKYETIPLGTIITYDYVNKWGKKYVRGCERYERPVLLELPSEDEGCFTCVTDVERCSVRIRNSDWDNVLRDERVLRHTFPDLRGLKDYLCTRAWSCNTGRMDPVEQAFRSGYTAFTRSLEIWGS